MRAQLVRSVDHLMAIDDRVVLLLGDIGVHGFRHVMQRFPDRTFNMGICEQAIVGAAAGMAKVGLIPIVHTIAPFLVERALEQIKLDFGYQQLPGLFVSVGASHDYATMGCSHHCPADCEIMKTIPGMRVYVPGSAVELDEMLTVPIHPTYIRLSEATHGFDGAQPVMRLGTRATVVAVGPMLGPVMAAVDDFDVSVVYYNVVAPFEHRRLLDLPDKILLVEPYYEGGLVREIVKRVAPRRLSTIGVPRIFQRSYGTLAEHDDAAGFNPATIRAELELML